MRAWWARQREAFKVNVGGVVINLALCVLYVRLNNPCLFVLHVTLALFHVTLVIDSHTSSEDS